jgi:acetyltransferase-like isoleucine patch superfamily enzyme
MKRNWREFSVAVRRRETPFYDRVFRLAKWVRGLSFPCIKPLHSFLSWEWTLRTSLWHNFWRIVYYEPMFKSQCVAVGPGFRMEYAGNGTTRIAGDLQLHIGSHVTIFDNTIFTGLKILDKPKLYIGDNTYIGPRVWLSVGREIAIGRSCAIGSTLITDNPGHSMNILNRLEAGSGSPAPEGIRPVKIGDFCWLPLATYVYPGVIIGDGVVALAGTHISQDIPPFCLVAGNPGKIIKKLPIPEELIEVVGRERYESYLESHRILDP